jgi:hypothetical protein
LEVGITGHNFERGPSKDHSTKSDDNSSHGLKAR